MSYFGKKAFNWWQYDKYHEPFNRKNHLLGCSRWKKTDIDLQSKILKRWFPIGYEFRSINHLFLGLGKSRNTSAKLKITGYYFCDKRKCFLIETRSEFGATQKINPISLSPTKDTYKRILRPLKLAKLGI